MRYLAIFMVFLGACSSLFALDLHANSVSGCRTILLQQDWESCDWSTPEGTWHETGGEWRLCQDAECEPGSAYTGNCYSGAYLGATFTRTWLISPAYVLPDTTFGDKISLRFWHWYEMGDCGAWRGCCMSTGEKDTGYVAIRKSGDTWTDKREFICSNKIWNFSEIDLTEYAGSSIEIGFALKDMCGCLPKSGWFVDDITIEQCRLCAETGPDMSICEGDSIGFASAEVDCGTPFYYYSWLPCEGLSNCNTLNPMASPESTTTYILTITDSNSPPQTASDTILVTVIPDLELSDTTIHLDSLICLDAGVPFDSCLWSTGQTASTICSAFSSPGDHLLWLTVFKDDCSSTDSLVVHAVYTDVEETSGQQSKMVSDLALNQNYPNPFNPQTRIEYTLPEESRVKLIIYNIFGRKVRTLVDEIQTAGYREVIWDGKDKRDKECSSGVYFYQVRAGDYTITRKMIKLK